MLINRYEEYLSFSDGLPFVFHSRLKRTDLIYSEETNWHENLEIQFCNAGCGSVLLDGEHVEFTEGDTVVVNSNVIHHTGTESELIYSCLIIDQKFCADCDIDPLRLSFEKKLRDPRIADIFKELESLYFSSSRSRIARLRALLLSLLIILLEDHSHQAAQKKISPMGHESVKAAISFIRNNYDRKFSLDELAKSVYSNKYVLSRSFKATVGRTVMDYANEYRIKQAALLISNGARICEAATLCGFNNLSFFSKTFKRYFGKLPSQIRASK
jgi:AraC-like DNA-binding protein